jgi:UDP-N-acetylmuramoyl-tripeptide--D-alanyl-D-alanine ligase
LLALPGEGKRLAILGLMAELGPDSDRLHRQTGRRLFQIGLDVLLAVGQEAWSLAAGFAAVGGEAYKVATKQEAVDWVTQNAGPGDSLLVKGSRVAAMEEVVTQLKRTLSSAEEKL